MADFSEEKTGSIDESIKKRSSKGRDFLEAAKLKGEVSDAEVSIQRKFNALGKKVFEMLNRGALNEDILKKDIGEVSNLFSRIKGLEETIEKVEAEALKKHQGANTIKCPQCEAPSRSGDNFCKICGSSLLSGKLITADFQRSAGSPLKREIDVTGIDDQNTKPVHQPSVNKAFVSDEGIRRRTSKAWIWMGIFTVICFAAGTISYVYYSSQKGEAPAEITAVPEPLKEEAVSPPAEKYEPPKKFIAADREPDKIEGEINTAFRKAGLNGITAAVSDSLEVTLKGSVKNNYEKDRAFEIAMTFKHNGIKRTRDMIFIVEQ